MGRRRVAACSLHRFQMRLHQLIAGIPELAAAGLPDGEVASVTADSRQVVPRSVFVAVRGGTVDGHRFLAEAARGGAWLLIGEQPQPDPGAPYCVVHDSRMTLAELAAAWHGHPARRLTMVGVTGTDGKTTTANLIHSILQAAGKRAGLVSTVHAFLGDHTIDTGLHVTTPEALDVQALLAEMVSAGLDHAVLETTSHGLAQRRVAACDIDIAVLTNITHEHLDYHGTFEAYREAKADLFRWLDTSPAKSFAPRAAILNRDDPSFAFLSGQTHARVLSYGVQEGVDIQGLGVRTSGRGIEVRLRTPGGAAEIASPLLGSYNAANILAAVAATVGGLGVSLENAVAGVREMRGIPGRMEKIDLGQPFLAIVDFAHTPNALRRALTAARSLTDGKVIVVFGCAGLRDREKRGLMGQAAAELADLAILTAEDPRTESLEAILDDMAAGARKGGGVEGQSYLRVPDRAQALRHAVSTADAGDLVIACGKGHEQSMCFGDTEHLWDDRTAMRAALSERMHVDGPAMPWLPTSSGATPAAR
jgi:UDP-N-acetylmuramoyl-L-alanyl-D-glutamate--2,6-diaminopimelate ligase